MQKKKVILWLSLTIVGGFMFLGSQAWEWGHFIHGDKGGIDTKTEHLVHIVQGEEMSSVYNLMEVNAHDGSHHHFSIEEVIKKLETKPSFNIRTANRSYLSHLESIKFLQEEGSEVVLGANLKYNEYGVQNFGQCFFVITGFHGFHVFSGVMILIVILINVIKGTYERRGHYEMVEKVGLYWHFVDLVWVFVFTFFYLV